MRSRLWECELGLLELLGQVLRASLPHRRGRRGADELGLSVGEQLRQERCLEDFPF